MSGRTAFVIDGFNVYHSLVDASRSLGLPDESGTKWLDLRGLCESYLALFGSDAALAGVFYFSALAHHLQETHPGVTARHQHHARVLRATGVQVELGRFKKRYVTCRHCTKSVKLHEEKETDVAVAMKVIEIFCSDLADRVVLMTGDTDLAPAVRPRRSCSLTKRSALRSRGTESRLSSQTSSQPASAFRARLIEVTSSTIRQWSRARSIRSRPRGEFDNRPLASYALPAGLIWGRLQPA